MALVWIVLACRTIFAIHDVVMRYWQAVFDRNKFSLAARLAIFETSATWELVKEARWTCFAATLGVGHGHHEGARWAWEAAGDERVVFWFTPCTARAAEVACAVVPSKASLFIWTLGAELRREGDDILLRPKPCLAAAGRCTGSSRSVLGTLHTPKGRATEGCQRAVVSYGGGGVGGGVGGGGGGHHLLSC